MEFQQHRLTPSCCILYALVALGVSLAHEGDCCLPCTVDSLVNTSEARFGSHWGITPTGLIVHVILVRTQFKMVRIDTSCIAALMANKLALRNLAMVNPIRYPMGERIGNTIVAIPEIAVAVPIAEGTFKEPAGCTKSGMRLSRFCDFIHESLSGLLIVGFEWGDLRAANGLALVAFWVSYAHWGSIGFQAAC